MNVDDDPLLERPGQNYSSVSDHARVQSPSTFFSRSFKSRTVATRLPFSKLTNSGHITQMPTNLRTGQCTDHSSNHPQDGRSKSNAIGSEHQFTASRTPHRKDSLISQSERVPATTGIQSCYDDGSNTCKVERNDLFDFGEDMSQEASVRAVGLLQQSQPLKRESDGLSSLFRANMVSAARPRRSYDSTRSSLEIQSRLSVGLENNTADTSQRRINEPGCPLQDRMALTSQSRRSSASVSNHDHSGDDLPALLIKGATDLRSTNFALEEKTKALQHLQDELDAAYTEKNNLLGQFALVKQKAMVGLAAHKRALHEMNTDLHSLKSKSQEVFSCAEQAKTSLEDIKELKQVVKKCTDQLELMTDNGVYAPTQEWKSVLNELQAQLTNKQQLIDMIRDRSDRAHSELAEAKIRIVELEETKERAMNSLQTISKEMAEAGSKMTELASLLGAQQQVNTDILAKKVELETKIDVLCNANDDLRRSLSQKEHDLESLSSLQREHDRLNKLHAECGIQLDAFHGMKDGLSKMEGLLQDRDARIQSLEASITIKDQATDDLQKRLFLAEAEVADQNALCICLKNDLLAIKPQLQKEFEAKTATVVENAALKEHQKKFVEEVLSLKSELDDYKAKVLQSEKCHEALQDRFDDQTIILQLEKKCHGDLQERLKAAEEAHAHTIDVMKQEAVAQSNSMDGKLSQLECLLCEREAELLRKEQEYKEMISDLEAQRSLHNRGVEDSLAASSEQAKRLQLQLESAKNEGEELRNRLQNLQSDYDTLRVESLKAIIPQEANTSEINMLKNEIDQLRRTNEDVVYRATSIMYRYEVGDLSTEEKKLVDAAHRASQIAHEQQLVVKKNEIRQRDNMIKVLEKGKSELECQLARVLNVRAKTHANAEPENGDTPLIDADNWKVNHATNNQDVGESSHEGQGRDRPTAMLEGANGPGEIELIREAATVARGGNSRSVLSSPKALSFTKLSEQATDASDVLRMFDVIPNEVTAAKRKRVQHAPTSDESEKNVRTTSSTRTRSRAGGDVEKFVVSKEPPKVKARKRR